jgi:uncharacterized protein (DUF2344 family)
MKISMGPALALGLESRQEVFDVEGISSFGAGAEARINEKLPAGLMVLTVEELPPGQPALSRAVRAARYAVRLEDDEAVGRARAAAANSWKEAVPALRELSVETAAGGSSLRFEVNLDQTEGETSTPRKVLEALLGIPPEAQASLRVTREATVLR